MAVRDESTSRYTVTDPSPSVTVELGSQKATGKTVCQFVRGKYILCMNKYSNSIDMYVIMWYTYRVIRFSQYQKISKYFFQAG